MDLFVIDKGGDQGLLNKNEYLNEELMVKVFGELKEKCEKGPIDETPNDDGSDSDYGYIPKNQIDFSDLIPKRKVNEKTKFEIEMERFEKLLVFAKENSKENNRGHRKVTSTVSSSIELDSDLQNLCKTNVKKEMQSCINDGLESRKSIPNPSKREKDRKGKKERAKTKGKEWYGLPATERTEEIRRDLEIIQMRSVLDPKHFYKKNDLKVLPKYFQVGTVLSSPLDYYNERGTRKTKKKSLVDELMADTEFQRFNKRKYVETLVEKRRKGEHQAQKKRKIAKKNKS